MKDYYKILEVAKDANQVQIKNAYRSLAKKYHPDKSNASSAAQLFTEVNEAYEILSDPNQKKQYDQRRSERTSYQTSPYQYTYKTTARSTYDTGRSQVDIIPYVPYFRNISYIALALSIILSVDFVLPRRVQEELITSVDRLISTSKTGQLYLYAVEITTDNSVFRLSPNEDNPFSIGKEVNIHKSIIFNLVTSMTLQENNQTKAYQMKTSIFANFSFSLITLIITSVIGSFRKKSPMNILNFGIVNGVLILLTIYFISVS